ncbi:MAG: ribonuclease HII [Flavobacteriales bacterium]|jgi:ribonuclease HII|nr:ribonuclease HII [Flavobacteriales bacterium]
MSLAPWIEKERLEAGCDEAGRGCLAGPVTAASVILSPNLALELVNDGVLDDSKKLNKKVRDALREKIESEALAWAVCHISPQEIDRINILQASLKAMREATKQLRTFPEFMLIDGNRFVSEKGLPPHECFVKGDGRFASIAAASVLAKTHRDERMLALHAQHPQYGWETNAGYPTKGHRAAIAQLGITKHHRKSFRQLPGQMSRMDAS